MTPTRKLISCNRTYIANRCDLLSKGSYYMSRNKFSDLYKAMKQISETGKGPESQIPSMGCNIKWLNN